MAVIDITMIIGISYRIMKTVEVVEALAAIAHEYRLAIYRLLVEQGPAGLPAGVIGERVGLPPSSLTFHLQTFTGQASSLRFARAAS